MLSHSVIIFDDDDSAWEITITSWRSPTVVQMKQCETNKCKIWKSYAVTVKMHFYADNVDGPHGGGAA